MRSLKISVKSRMCAPSYNYCMVSYMDISDVSNYRIFIVNKKCNFGVMSQYCDIPLSL